MRRRPAPNSPTAKGGLHALEGAGIPCHAGARVVFLGSPTPATPLDTHAVSQRCVCGVVGGGGAQAPTTSHLPFHLLRLAWPRPRTLLESGVKIDQGTIVGGVPSRAVHVAFRVGGLVTSSHTLSTDTPPGGGFLLEMTAVRKVFTLH